MAVYLVEVVSFNYERTGDFYFDRYIACPSGSTKTKYVITHEDGYHGYVGSDIRYLNSTSEFKSGNFDARNSEMSHLYINILCVIDGGKLRDPTKQEKSGELRCQKGKIDRISVLKEALKSLGEVINKNDDLVKLKQKIEN